MNEDMDARITESEMAVKGYKWELLHTLSYLIFFLPNNRTARILNIAYLLF